MTELWEYILIYYDKEISSFSRCNLPSEGFAGENGVVFAWFIPAQSDVALAILRVSRGRTSPRSIWTFLDFRLKLFYLIPFPFSRTWYLISRDDKAGLLLLLLLFLFPHIVLVQFSALKRLLLKNSQIGFHMGLMGHGLEDAFLLRLGSSIPIHFKFRFFILNIRYYSFINFSFFLVKLTLRTCIMGNLSISNLVPWTQNQV